MFLIGTPEETIKDVEELYSSLISEMLPTRDEILRATPAGEVLKCLGRSLRQDEGEYYHKSVPSTRISSFYSHSWHGPTWAKILTLMLLNNGSAAVLLSLASVLLVGLLYGLGALPPFPLGWGCVVALSYLGNIFPVLGYLNPRRNRN